jgi:hypothetical protein
MRSGIILAWLIGEGIIVWRSVSKNHRPPMPGTLLVSSGEFALLALLAEYEPARAAATAIAFGLDLAAFLSPGLLGAQAAAGQPSAATKAPTPSGTIPAGSTGNPIGEAP